MPPARIAIYLEKGSKRTFACAAEWPGWCRSGRDENAALAALLEYAPRYAYAVAKTRLGFSAPRTLADLEIVERLAGDATTDFGAPGGKMTAHGRPVDDADLRRLRTLTESAWRAFDAAIDEARGKTLAKGPRGGGRELGAIVDHVREAERGYLSALGWKHTPKAKSGPAALDEVRAAVLEGLAASARGAIAAKGPRGGARWKPRFFAHRLAWHALDHAWEIEDRVRS